MSGVTGFATGMIAGALWLVFFIGLGLTARNSPGHPFKSIRRFRSSSRSLDLDVPSALKAQDQHSPEMRVVNAGSKPVRDTGLWDEPRRPRDPGDWDETIPKESSRQFQRPVLRPVPDLPEPTMQIDSSTFFEPEHPRSRPRPARNTGEFEQTLLRPTFIDAGEPELMHAASNRPGGFVDNRSGGAMPPSNAGGSNLPPLGPPEPPQMSEPAYPVSPGFAPQSFPIQQSESSVSQPATGPQQTPGPQQATGPQEAADSQPQALPANPAFPPPEPVEEPKPGRFGKKNRKADKKAEKAEKPAAASPTSPPAPAPAVPTTVAQEKAKKDKKGMFKIHLKEEEPQAVSPPRPSVPARPAASPTPRFSAPYNYVPPTSTPVTPPPFYKTVPPTGPASPWGPPASFNPPASPSFSNWGPNTTSQSPAEPEQPAGESLSPPALNANGNNQSHQEEVEAGAWPLGLASRLFAGSDPVRQDPQLPAFIELSMFQDPTSADDISAEQESGDETETDSEIVEEASAASRAEEAWLAADAWPGPKENKRKRKQDPWPMDAQPVEETQLLEQHWPQESSEPEEPPSQDWTSADTPWPGETRRPAEPTWADEAPAAESKETPQWGDEPWQQETLRPAPSQPAAEDLRAHQQPAAQRSVVDPWGQEHQIQHVDIPAADPKGQESSRQPVAEYPTEDPWTQARARQPEPVQENRVAEPAEPERPVHQEAEPASNGSQIFVDDDDWKPLSIDLKLDDDRPPPNPITVAATRLKAAEAAIKVENGLAYVLVDDEGRPVLR